MNRVIWVQQTMEERKDGPTSSTDKMMNDGQLQGTLQTIGGLVTLETWIQPAGTNWPINDSTWF